MFSLNTHLHAPYRLPLTGTVSNLYYELALDLSRSGNLLYGIWSNLTLPSLEDSLKNPCRITGSKPQIDKLLKKDQSCNNLWTLPQHLLTKVAFYAQKKFQLSIPSELPAHMCSDAHLNRIDRTSGNRFVGNPKGWSSGFSYRSTSSHGSWGQPSLLGQSNLRIRLLHGCFHTWYSWRPYLGHKKMTRYVWEWLSFPAGLPLGPPYPSQMRLVLTRAKGLGG